MLPFAKRYLIAVILMLCSGSCLASAEPVRPKAPQAGNRAPKKTQQHVVSAAERGKADVAAWLASLDKSFQSGAVRPIDDLSDAGVSYFVSLYFFCAVRVGDCPFILDTVLEGDVIQSKSEGVAACPTMSRFWKTWLAGDFDARTKYSISPAIAEKLDSFNESERPQYVKCKDTVALIVEDRSNFEARYASDGDARQSLDRTRKLLDEIWEKGVDISVGNH